MGTVLADCLRSLDLQTFDGFETVVVDNSGEGRVRCADSRVRVIVNPRNLGFGAALNQAGRQSRAPYFATINDDAVADPRWLEMLVADADAHPQAGLFASQVRLAGTGLLDSAAMLLASDGSSKQRGHRQAPERFQEAREALLPSGSAALYRRIVLEEIGWFDETFHLYCEDTDVGLRARWAGWECRYVPEAVVEHCYSHSSGRASPLKAYLVERNRLYLVVKNFPLRMLWRVPLAAMARYLFHLRAIRTGDGKSAEFARDGHSVLLLPWLVIRAHLSLLAQLPHLLASRRRIFRARRLSSPEFQRLATHHAISIRQVAAL